MVERESSEAGYNEPDFQYQRQSDSKKISTKLVLQHDEQDCGAASLATIAKIYGINRSVRFFRDLLDIGPYGASLYGIVKAAHSLGFKTSAVETDFDSLRDLYTPMICPYSDHFVVVYEVTEKDVLIGDPAFGVLRRNKEQFQNDWDGYALLFNPSPQLEQFKHVKYQKLKLLRDLIRNNRSLVWKILVVSALSSAVGVILPLISGKVFDLFAASDDRANFRYFVAVLLTIKIANVVMTSFKQLASGWLDLKIMSDFTDKLIDKVLALPLRAFKSRTLGDYTSRFGNIFSVGQFIHGSLLNGLLDFVSAMVFLFILGFYHWKLAVIAASLGIVILCGSMLLNRSIRSALYELARLESEAYNRFYDAAKNTVTIRLFNSQEKYRSAMSKCVSSINQNNWSITRKQNSFNVLTNGMLLLASVEIIFLIVDGLELTNFTLGDSVAVSGWIMQFILPVAGFGGLIQQFGAILITFERLEEIFESKTEHQKEELTLEPKDANLQDDVIRFENVSFRYGNEESPEILNKVSFSILQNSITAIVGASGSGKSTILQLIPRLYDPSIGRILLNGKDISSYHLAELRNEISYVSQETKLISGTFLENIVIGDNDFNESRLADTLKLVDLYDFIMNFPKGIYTKISEDEKGLSGGQKQRIAIARALYKSAPVLILDEPTSALDGITEAKILESVTNKIEKTLILSSHRLSTVALASHIIVMDKGQVIEQGPMAELIKGQGLFYRLFKGQMYTEN